MKFPLSFFISRKFSRISSQISFPVLFINCWIFFPTMIPGTEMTVPNSHIGSLWIPKTSSTPMKKKKKKKRYEESLLSKSVESCFPYSLFFYFLLSPFLVIFLFIFLILFLPSRHPSLIIGCAPPGPSSAGWKSKRTFILFGIRSRSWWTRSPVATSIATWPSWPDQSDESD